MNRQRLSWTPNAAPSDPKRASAHPATPDEGAASPAHTKDDPGQDAYKNGDTSSWAEDPTKGPYPNSAHPATPDEGPASPAYKAAAYEKKAEKCIRIATTMLGTSATAAAIEDQALSLMDLPDSSLTATLKRLGQEEEVEEKEESKTASDKISSLETRMARLERILIRLAGDEEEVEDEEAKKKAGEEKEEVEEEAKKKAGEEKVEEEEEEEAKKKAAVMSEEEQMLEKMLKEEGMFGDTASDIAIAPPKEEACGEMGVDLSTDMDDPMGVMDVTLDPDEQMILAKLYGKAGEEKVEEEKDEEAKKKAGEEKVEEEDEEAKKKAAVRAAAQRPQAKKASVGPQKLGAVAKTASASGSDVDELSKLWTSAPDVSRHF